MVKTSKYKKTMVALALGVACMSGAASVQAQPKEISRGAVIAATCYTCHGTYGISQDGMPNINGISADRMKTTLIEYKEKKRASTVMGRHASGYTDEELAQVANYLGNLKK